MKTVAELAEITEAKLIGDPAHLITGVDELGSAQPTDASFLAHRNYLRLMTTTKAGVICVDPSTPLVKGKNFLISSDPSATFQKIIKLFMPSYPSSFSGIHPTAVIHPTAQMGEDVTVGPYCVIDANCIIGRGTTVAPSVIIGPAVEIGQECLLHSHVTIRERCKLGHRVIIQPGAVIGSCGYGYTTDEKGVHHKLEHFGTVIIEDDVEIGANTTIDRARFKATRIRRGTKIDNLVQIGHNVELGPDNLIVAQTGISGSVKTGRRVVMAGQTGVVGHINIADGAQFAARSGIKKSITSAGKYGGDPAIWLHQHQRQQVTTRQCASKLQSLEEQIQQILHRLDCNTPPSIS